VYCRLSSAPHTNREKIKNKNDVTGTENQSQRTYHGSVDLQSFPEPTAQVDRTELQSENGRHRY